MRKKWEVFAEAYLRCFNATQAAIEAGYSKRSAYNQGSRLMKNDEIAAYVRARIDEMVMSSDEVLLRLAEQARGNIGEFITLSPDEIATHPRAHLVKKVRRRTVKTEHHTTIDEEIELYDSQAALVQIGRVHGLFTDKLKVESWQDEAIAMIRRGDVDYPMLAEELGDDLATQLYQAAGVPVRVNSNAE